MPTHQKQGNGSDPQAARGGLANRRAVFEVTTLCFLPLPGNSASFTVIFLAVILPTLLLLICLALWFWRRW